MLRYTRCAIARIACAFGVFFLASCSVSDFTEWFEEDDPREEIIDDLPNRVEIEEVWRQNVDIDGERVTRLRPLIDVGTVFVGNDTGDVYAYRLTDGEEIWERNLDISVSFALGGDRRLPVLGGADGRVIALRGDNGKVRWRTRLHGAVMAISKRHRDMLIVRTDDDKITALSATTGKRLWSVSMPSPQLTLLGVSIPLLYKDMAVVGLDDGYVALLNLKNGRTINRIRVGSSSNVDGYKENITDIDGHIAIRDGLLFAAAYQGPLMALDLNTLKVRWLAQMGSDSGPIVAGRHVYMADANGGVVALNRASGDKVWRNSLLEVKNITYPTVIRHYVVTSDDEGYVYWLSRDKGKIQSRERFTWTESAVLSVSALSKNSVLILNDAGDLILSRVASMAR